MLVVRPVSSDSGVAVKEQRGRKREGERGAESSEKSTPEVTNVLQVKPRNGESFTLVVVEEREKEKH